MREVFYNCPNPVEEALVKSPAKKKFNEQQKKVIVQKTLLVRLNLYHPRFCVQKVTFFYWPASSKTETFFYVQVECF